jgi:hypothetical protein
MISSLLITKEELVIFQALGLGHALNDEGMLNKWPFGTIRFRTKNYLRNLKQCPIRTL